MVKGDRKESKDLEQLLGKARAYKAGDSRLQRLESLLEGFPEELKRLGVTKHLVDVGDIKMTNQRLDRVRAYVDGSLWRRLFSSSPSQEDVSLLKYFVKSYAPKAARSMQGGDWLHRLRKDLAKVEHLDPVNLFSEDHEGVLSYKAGLVRVLNLEQAGKAMEKQYLSLYQEALRVLSKL
ncbi:MAG: hypothetical protein AABX70_06705 [Nanoarchaeota archaeon]